MGEGSREHDLQVVVVHHGLAFYAPFDPKGRPVAHLGRPIDGGPGSPALAEGVDYLVHIVVGYG